MIHGLLHGIRRCLLRVTQGFAARRRPGTRRKRGGFMGRAGIDLFIEDGAYTTLSSAVVILVVLTLLFSSTAAIWSMSRAGDTQVAADSGALAGANVVSSYHTAATVVDASILSLGLAGFATIGTGLVAILIPGAEVYRRRCLYHALLCGRHSGGAYIAVFVDRGDMEHVARRRHPGGGR